MKIFVFLLALSLVSPVAAQTPSGETSPVTVTVDWKREEGRVSPEQYGINLFAASDSQNIGAAPYYDNLKYMGVRLMRLHNGGMMENSSPAGWMDTKQKIWDAAKITKVLKGLQSGLKKNGGAFLINIPSWPEGMDADKDGFLDRDQFDAYAKLLASLVRIANNENRLGVRYWEVTNEWDGRYFVDFYDKGGWGSLKDVEKPDRWGEAAEIYNRCAKAMKAVDPTIQIGGLAASRPDLTAAHERFIKATLPNLDFFSFHAYASGSAETPDAEIYDAAQNMGKYAASVVALTKKLSPAREIPVFLDEFNISWTWETRDPRMTNDKGAVFDALALISAAKAGAASVMGWNEKDGIYGKSDGENKRRPGANLLKAFNDYLTGRRVYCVSSDEKRIVAFAISRRLPHVQTIALVNRTNAPQKVTLVGGGRMGQRFNAAKPVDFATLQSGDFVIFSDNPTSAELPPHSVIFLTTLPRPSFRE